MRSLILLVLLALPTVLIGADPPKPPTPSTGSAGPIKMSREDMYHGQAIDAKFTSLQAQFNALQSAAQALAKERDDLKSSVCKDAKILDADCSIDYTQGLVTKSEPKSPPPAANSKP